MSAPFRIEPLAEHDRAAFSCGELALDQYFQKQATQDIRRHIANCFVAVEVTSGQVAGFYTLASASLLLTELPEEISKRLPRYPMVPAVRVGRLAVDQRFQGRKLGAALLNDAARRTLHGSAAAFGLLVDAKHAQAAAFYRHHGFFALASQPGTWFLPLQTAKQTLIVKRSEDTPDSPT